MLVNAVRRSRYFIMVNENGSQFGCCAFSHLCPFGKVPLCFRCEEVLELVLHEVFMKFDSVLHVFERLPRVVVIAVTCPLDEYFESFSGILPVRPPLPLVSEDVLNEKLLLNVSLNNSRVRVFTFVIERVKVRLVGGEDCVGVRRNTSLDSIIYFWGIYLIPT